jgi:hypothetical protein
MGNHNGLSGAAMRTPLMKQSDRRLRMRRLALLASTAILLSSLSSATLLANDECGPGPTVTCTSARNPYASGIIYDPVSYSYAWGDDFDDASGATIDLENTASLLGEVAARLGVDLAFEPGLADLYVDVALRREFLGETSAQASGLTFTHELPGAAARLATGVAMHLLDEKLTLFLDAAYAKGDDAEEISATGGLRLSY